MFGIGRDQVHGVADHQRRAPRGRTGAPSENVQATFSCATLAGVDLVERAVAGVGVVARLAAPFAGRIVGREVGGGAGPAGEVLDRRGKTLVRILRACGSRPGR